MRQEDVQHCIQPAGAGFLSEPSRKPESLLDETPSTGTSEDPVFSTHYSDFSLKILNPDKNNRLKTQKSDFSPLQNPALDVFPVTF